jgi:glycosyltransferase involved in cell wall biosynthesis
MRVIALVATYNEQRFIASLIEHLFQQGVEVYLMDNCSTDDTVAIASQYLHKGLVGVETLPRQGCFSLTDQLMRKEQLAASLDADWLMHIDADERHYAPSKYKSLANAFAEAENQGFNAVNFMEYTFVPTREQPFHDHPRFADTMRCYYPFAPFLPHRLNAWKKQDGPVDLVSSGGHVMSFPGLSQFPESFIMKHYMILSMAHVEEKYCALQFGAEDKKKGWGYPRVDMTVDMIQFPSEAELYVVHSGGELDATNPRNRHFWADEYDRRMKVQEISSRKWWHRFVKPKFFRARDQHRPIEPLLCNDYSVFLSPSVVPSHAVQSEPVQSERHENKAASVRLRILLILPANPYPPVAGAYMRWWAIVRYLGQRHNLTLVMFSRPLNNEAPEELLKFCTKVYAVDHGGPQPESAAQLPFKVRRHYTLKMRNAMQAIAKESFDVAIVEQIFLAPYRMLIQAPVILSEQNIESSLLAQTAGASFYGQLPPGFENATKEAQLLRQYEDEIWPEFSWRTAVSERDRSIIQQRARRGETWLVENGIDLELSLKDPRPDTNNVLFTGLLAYYPNVDAVLYFWKEIWPHVLKLSSTAQLIVAGRAPAPDIVTLANQSGFKLVADPDDMRSIAADCSVSICPLRLGSGTRLKILEAMAWGVPVVSTSIGCEGLAVEDDRELLIRDDPAEFAFAVHRLLNDAELWKKLSENGRRLVTERYGWDTVLEPLDRLCKKVASEH